MTTTNTLRHCVTTHSGGVFTAGTRRACTSKNRERSKITPGTAKTPRTDIQGVFCKPFRLNHCDTDRRTVLSCYTTITDHSAIARCSAVGTSSVSGPGCPLHSAAPEYPDRQPPARLLAAAPAGAAPEAEGPEPWASRPADRRAGSSAGVPSFAAAAGGRLGKQTDSSSIAGHTRSGGWSV